MKLTKSKLNEMVLEALDNELNELGYEIDPDVGKNSWIHPERKKDVNQGVYLQGFSNKEARSIIDGSLQSKERDVPEYIQLDNKNKTVKLVRKPKFSEVPYPVVMEPNLVIEYYSR